MCFLLHLEGFPGGSDDKKSACNAGDLGLIPGLRRSPGGGHGNPLQYSSMDNLHGQSPWGHQESDTTKRLGAAMYLDLDCLSSLCGRRADPGPHSGSDSLMGLQVSYLFSLALCFLICKMGKEKNWPRTYGIW